MTEIALSRRRFLNSSAGVVGLSSTAGPRRSEQARISRRLVIPTVDAFEDDYVGQFVFIDESADESVGDVPIEECGFEGWSAEQTQVYQGQLLDRRQELPIAVELTVYADGEKAQIEPATHFIIRNAVSCPDGYVGLEAEWVPTRALVGKPPGPTVTETGADGQTGTELPGFGLVDAGLGIGGLLLLRAIARVRS